MNHALTRVVIIPLWNFESHRFRQNIHRLNPCKSPLKLDLARVTAVCISPL
jgi:hypothetical protein